MGGQLGGISKATTPLSEGRYSPWPTEPDKALPEPRSQEP